MAQHDFNIANAGGATVRADINNVLAAIQSSSSGTSAPSSTVAGMLWLDTSGGLPYALKVRDGGNNHWLTIGTVDDPGADKGMEIAPSKIKLPSSGGIYESDGSTEILTESSGAVTLKNTTINANNTFPSGHVIRHFYDEHDFAGSVVTISGDTYWSDLEIEITNPSTSNYILVTTMIPSIYNFNTIGHGLNMGFAYSTDNWSTPQRLGIQDQYDAQMPWQTGVIAGQSLTARFAHPTTSDYKIRMRLNKYASGNMNIGQASSGNMSVATMSAFEIQG